MSILTDIDIISDSVDIKQLIISWLKENNINDYEIADDYKIDVRGSVCLFRYPHEELPPYVNFDRVLGAFTITESNLKTLRGCPRVVGEFFSCSETNVKSLEFAPTKVLKSFRAINCRELEELFTKHTLIYGELRLDGCSKLKEVDRNFVKAWAGIIVPDHLTNE